MENKATDYTHENDPIGNHTQFGAPLIGKQFTVRQNDTKEDFYTFNYGRTRQRYI